MAAVAALSAGAAAQEYDEVLSFDALYEVRGEGTIRVTEEITVRRSVAGFRGSLPRILVTSYRRPGTLIHAQIPLRVVSVHRDGRPVNYLVQAFGGDLGWDGLKVWMGHGNDYLAAGDYRYTLVYETDRWATYGPLHDVLYRNVTGRGWTVPIRTASARVRIPELEAPLAMSAFIEGANVSAGAGQASWDPEGEAILRAPRSLAPGESFVIRLELPKWVLQAPSWNRERTWFWMDWGGWIEAAVAVLLVAGVYTLMWWRVGIDRSGDSIVIQYEPPSGLSPAALGFLRDRRHASRHFAAAVVSMAVQGTVRIRRQGKRWLLERAGPGRSLAPDERAAHRVLFDGVDLLPLELSNNVRLGRAAHALRQTLAARLEAAYFVRNERWFFAGLCASLLGYGVLAWRWRYDVPGGGFLLGPTLGLWTALTGSMLLRAVHYLRHGRAAGETVSLAFGGVGLVVSAPLVVVEVGLVLMMLEVVPTHMVAASWVLGATNVTFYHLLQRPNAVGRALLDRVEGFYRFLSAVEADRFARTLGRDTTPDTYERFLPHAIALGLERRWGSRFSDALAPPAGGSATTGYDPAWYASDADSERPGIDLGEELAAHLGAPTSREP